MKGLVQTEYQLSEFLSTKESKVLSKSVRMIQPEVSVLANLMKYGKLIKENTKLQT